MSSEIYDLLVRCRAEIRELTFLHRSSSNLTQALLAELRELIREGEGFLNRIEVGADDTVEVEPFVFNPFRNETQDKLVNQAVPENYDDKSDRLTIDNCVKCGEDRIKVQYMAMTDQMSCTCCNCGYNWRVKPLNPREKK